VIHSWSRAIYQAMRTWLRRRAALILKHEQQCNVR
jgi:hypothetical protein